ncbi:hypothetical protein J4443_00480 [Candidatus Woesearchaeota archaeon]|nr:hypothetical protein [Candidatus Woesearchaeota archaeon]
MEHPIVTKIIKDGINSVDLSMLDDRGRGILSYVGERLYKLNRIPEAVEILERAEDFEKLRKIGDEFMRQNKVELAAMCFIPTKDKERLNNAAALCVKAMNYRLAAEAYFAAGNKEMAMFLKENYC